MKTESEIAPTNQGEALKMIAPLNPRPDNTTTLIEKYLAFEKLEAFIKLLLPAN